MQAGSTALSRSAASEAYARQLDTLARRCRRPRGAESLRAELADELDCRGAALLDRLLGFGITPDTAAAFEALPLVEVAWADGDVNEEERWRVLTAATAFGLELGSAAHAQLELWLSRKPDESLFEAWLTLAGERSCRGDDPASARRLLRGVWDTALADGGVLGLGAISRAERAVIDRVERALGHHANEED